MNISSHDFAEIRWHGHWIWAPEEPIEPRGFWTEGINPSNREAHVLFRKTVVLESVPSRVPARITADSRYVLYVNGHELIRGPIRSQPRRLFYDLVDLAPALRPGLNVLAVYVKYYGRAQSFWMPAVPNNTLGRRGALVFEANFGRAGWIVSDESWRACKTDAWLDEGQVGLNHGDGVPVEVFDARRLPADWREPSFDDRAWGAAQVVRAMHIGGFARSQPPTDPYGPLWPRPIAPLAGELQLPVRLVTTILANEVDRSLLSPIARVRASCHVPIVGTERCVTLPVTLEVPSTGAIRLTIDMGRIVSGLTTFALCAPAGTVVDISYTEEPLSADVSMDKMSAGMRYIARGERDEFEAFESNGFRYAHLLIHNVMAPVTLTRFAVRELLYPWAEGADFACNDDEINAIYHAGRRTVALCSHDTFIDCPTREQRAWVGDGVVHQMVHLAANCDWRLARHFLVVSNAPRYDGILPMTIAGDLEASGIYTIPDWSLHWIHALYNLYWFTGDRELIADLLPTARRILAWFTPYQTQIGVLKDVPEWTLVDWAAVSNEDCSASLTALWARGLREFAEMAGWLGEYASRQWAEDRYRRVAAGFEIFWDEARGSYVDHVVNGERCPEMSQIPGAAAIVAGLAPRERHARIIRTITDPKRVIVRSWLGNGRGEQSMERWQAQVQRGHYAITWDVEREIVKAEPFMSYLVHDAVAQAGLADLLPTLYRAWSQFLVDGYDTIGECWDFGTHVHGWSCTPTRDLIFYTLGVYPATPGYTIARVAPRPGPLKWLRGSVPTPYGLLIVSITPETISIESPIPVVLDLPGQAPRQLAAGRYTIVR